MMNHDEMTAAAEIAAFMRRLYRQGLTTTSGGNLSVRVGNTVLMTPGGTDKGRLKAAEVGRIDLCTGRVLDEGFKPTCEIDMHLEIYRRRQDISAIVHAHPVTACAFAAADREVSNRLVAESYAVLGRIGVVPYITFGTPELAAAAAEVAENCNAMIMNNHGAMTLGKSLLEAFDRLEVLENSARITLICEYMMRSAVPLSPEMLRELDRR